MRVTDSGIGIEPEFLPHVFDRFRQADSTTTRVHGGVGLGLSIARQLVEAHQGAITVDSDGKDRGIDVHRATAGGHTADRRRRE